MQNISISIANRPVYTKKLFDALLECFNIEEHTVYIFCEPSNQEVIATAEAFCENTKVESHLLVNASVLGCNRNIHQCLDFGLSTGDFHIHLEDDTIPARDALVYFEYCNSRYRHSAQVLSVTSYSKCSEPHIPIKSASRQVYQRHGFTPWGWATWADRWKDIEPAIAKSFDTDVSWDTSICRCLPLAKEVFPYIARTQNIGADGGTFCPSASWHAENQFNQYWIESSMAYVQNPTEFRDMTTEIAMPICELCDRYTIALLKKERLSDDQLSKDDLQKQIDYYLSGIDKTNHQLLRLVSELYDINGKMWDAEHDIRKGLDDTLGLEEIGRRAIAIRDLNKIRVSIKNAISEVASQKQFVDCKMNHASS